MRDNYGDKITVKTYPWEDEPVVVEVWEGDSYTNLVFSRKKARKLIRQIEQAIEGNR